MIILQRPIEIPSLFEMWETSEEAFGLGKQSMKYRGTIASDMSGKLGGIVASHNSYGTYFRRLVKPAQPRTPGQVAQRAAFGSISQQWRGLSATQRQTWISSAPQFQLTSSTGNPILPTGQNLWMWVNALRQRLGIAILTNPPATTTVPVISPYSFTVSTLGVVSVTFTAGDEWNESGGGMLLSITAPIQPGRKFVETYVPLGQISGVATSPQNFTLPFVYDAAAGLQLKMKASATVADGRRSQPTFAYLFPPVPDITIASIGISPATITLSAAPLISATIDAVDQTSGATFTATITPMDTFVVGAWTGTPLAGHIWATTLLTPSTGTGIVFPQQGTIIA